MEIFTVKRPVKRYMDGEFSEVSDDVLRETVLYVCIEGGNEESPLVELVCIPEYLEELVLGYLYTEGVIDTVADVDSIVVEVADTKDAAKPADIYTAHVRLNKYGRSHKYKRQPGCERPGADRVLKKPDIDPAIILKNANLLLDKSDIFKQTGNVHSAMLCRGSDVLYFCEDIGRYNAFDKCVGRALKDKTDLSSVCVYTSGRLPGSVAQKVVKAGIPMVVSRSAPTDVTLEIAARHGLTIVGFARGGRFNIY